MSHPLLHHLVDYAGLFPPAALELEPAVREYTAHRKQAEAWMLGRFIIPLAQLGGLHAFADLFPATAPLRLCVLPGAGDTAALRVGDAVEASDRFEAEFGGHTVVEVFEMRMSQTFVAPAELSGAASLAGSRVLYLEWPAEATGLQGHLEAVAEARAGGTTNLGVKIRCGGTEAGHFPSVQVVAEFVAAVARLRLPFKATAGLHHPVRHDRDGLPMHGFLNVFGGHVLALEHGLDADGVAPIIAERDPAAFSLKEKGFRWRDLSATAAGVQTARNLAHAYGSCSFSEPIEDLDATGWFGHPS